MPEKSFKNRNFIYRTVGGKSLGNALILTSDCDIASLLREWLAPFYDRVDVSDKTVEDSSGYNLIICDCDTVNYPQKYNGRVVFFSRHAERRRGIFILRPFPEEDFVALCTDMQIGEVIVDSKRRTVTVDSVTSSLTAHEFSLFCRLFEHRGEFVTREELLSDVFGDMTKESMLAVYIHRLREKTEHGRKLILYDRGRGYRLALDGDMGASEKC